MLALAISLLLFLAATSTQASSSSSSSAVNANKGLRPPIYEMSDLHGTVATFPVPPQEFPYGGSTYQTLYRYVRGPG